MKVRNLPNFKVKKKKKEVEFRNQLKMLNLLLFKITINKEMSWNLK